MVGDASKDVAEVSLGIEIVELGGPNESEVLDYFLMPTEEFGDRKWAALTLGKPHSWDRFRSETLDCVDDLCGRLSLFAQDELEGINASSWGSQLASAS